MNDIFKFLTEYKEIILSSLCVVLSLLSILLKRRPKSLDDFKYAVSRVLSCVPSLVSKVERPGNGAEKKAQVIDSSILAVSGYLGRSLSDSEKDYVRTAVSDSIEDVLSSPKKKC